VLGVTVRRPVVKETTALGAAYLAGLAEGVWSTPAEAAAAWSQEAEFTSNMPSDEVQRRFDEWRRGVERSRGWAVEAAD